MKMPERWDKLIMTEKKSIFILRKDRKKWMKIKIVVCKIHFRGFKRSNIALTKIIYGLHRSWWMLLWFGVIRNHSSWLRIFCDIKKLKQSTFPSTLKPKISTRQYPSIKSTKIFIIAIVSKALASTKSELFLFSPKKNNNNNNIAFVGLRNESFCRMKKEHAMEKNRFGQQTKLIVQRNKVIIFDNSND